MIEKIKEAVQTVKDSWDKHYIETDGSEQAEALEVLIKSAEAWEKVIEELGSLVEKGNEVARTEENIAVQIAYSFALGIINKHLSEVEE